MDINKTNDATFEINLNNSKIKRYKDEELKKLARKQKRLKVRIVKVKLKNGITEVLFTNLPKEIASPEELKQLYGERWTIEKDYDRLKKQTIHRKIHRKKTNHHRTRLLQPHIPTKPTNRNKTRRRTKKENQNKQQNTLTNIIPMLTYSSEKLKINYQDY